MDIEFLQEFGLTRNEAKVYLALVEIGQSLAGTIADKSKIHRRNVYDALERLVEKGLVVYVIKYGRKYYEAVNPEKLIDILKEKLDIAKNNLPELIQRYNVSKSKQEVRVFSGLGGMKTFYEDVYKEKKDFFVIGSTGKAYSRLKFFIPSWIKRMGKLKLRKKVLWNYDAVNKGEFKELRAENKILPKNFSSPTQIFLYGEKSAVLIWSEEPLCILIKSKEITNGFMKYFNLLWKIAKR